VSPTGILSRMIAGIPGLQDYSLKPVAGGPVINSLNPACPIHPQFYRG
jgi:hypothetical protein